MGLAPRTSLCSSRSFFSFDRHDAQGSHERHTYKHDASEIHRETERTMEEARTKDNDDHRSEGRKVAAPDAEREPAGETGGQRTVTIGKSAYAILTSAYEKNKVKLLERENIRTLTEYARARLLRGVEEDVLEGRFEIIGRHEDNIIAVMDYYEQVKVEVAIQPRSGSDDTMDVYCRHDRSGDCDHVGFVLADVDVIKRARELGVRLRKAEQPEDVREALRVFEILSAASDEGLVGEDSFIRALARGGEFTKKQAGELLEKLREQGEVYTPRAHHFRRSGGTTEREPRMPTEK